MNICTISLELTLQDVYYQELRNELKKMRESQERTYMMSVIQNWSSQEIFWMLYYILLFEFIFWILWKHLLSWVCNLFYFVFNRLLILLVPQIRQIIKIHASMKMEERKIRICLYLNMVVCFFCRNIYFGGCIYIIYIILLF